MSKTKKLVGADGQLYDVPAERVEEALGSGNFREQTSREIKEKLLQKKYGEGEGNALKAGLAGIARSATFGLSDVALTETGIASPLALREIQERNPLASGLGELGGVFIDPFTGLASAGAKLGITGAEAIAKAGRAGFAETLAKKIVPDLSSAGEHLAAKEILSTFSPEKQAEIIAHLRSLNEVKALESVGQKISFESALENKIADKLENSKLLEAYQKEQTGLTGISHESSLALQREAGATPLLTETAPGALPEVGTVAQKGFKEKLVQDILTKGPQKAVSGALSAAAMTLGQEISEEALGRHDLNAEKLLASVGMNALVGGGIGLSFFSMERALTRGMEKILDNPKLIEKVDSFASKKAFESFKPNKKDLRDALRRNGGIEAIGKEIRENGFDRAFESATEKFEAIKTVSDDVGSKIGDIIDKTDKSGIVLNGEQIAKKLSEDLNKLARDPLYRDSVKDLLKQINYYSEYGIDNPLTLSELHKFRQNLDDKINYLSLEQNPLKNSVKGIRTKLEDIIKTGIENTLGKDALKEYNTLKDKYGRLKVVEKMAQRQSESEATKSIINSFDSLSLAGHAAASVLTGSPLPVALGLATTFGGKYLKEHAAELASNAASSILKIQALSKHINKFDDKVNYLVKDFIEKPTLKKALTKEAISEKIPEINDEKFNDRINAMASNPNVFANNIERALPGVSAAAPKIGLSINSKAALAMRKLASQLSHPIKSINFLKTNNKNKIPDFERHNIKQQIRVIKHPLSVLEDMSNGKIDQNTVATLKEVYPAIYEDIKSKIIMGIANNPDKVSYEKRVQLSMFFDTTLDDSMAPDYINNIQNIYRSQDKQEQQPQKRAITNLKIKPESYQTEIERITYG